MKPARVLTKFEKTFATWESALRSRPDEAFARKLDASAWTLGEVCDHVAFVSEFFLREIDPLAAGKGQHEKVSMAGRFIFLVGSFPPVRIKVPELPEGLERIARPEEIGKAEAERRFADIGSETRRLAAVAASADPKLRSRHPVAGFVNATQWYQLSEMHMRHHIRQLRRIQNELG